MAVRQTVETKKKAAPFDAASRFIRRMRGSDLVQRLDGLLEIVFRDLLVRHLGALDDVVDNLVLEDRRAQLLRGGRSVLDVFEERALLTGEVARLDRKSVV